MTTRKQAEECSGAYVIGEADGDDGLPCRPQYHFSDLGCVEAYIIGYKAATGTLAPLPAPEREPVDGAADEAFDAPAACSYFAHLFPDGSLQRVIDYGARLREAEDARQDEEFNRRGGWL